MPKPPTTIGYAFRPDGMYLIEKICTHCGERFDVLAIQPIRVNDPGFCGACWQVSVWEDETEPLKILKVIQPPARRDYFIEIGWALLGGFVLLTILSVFYYAVNQ